jgi:hypothetical protein
MGNLLTAYVYHLFFHGVILICSLCIKFSNGGLGQVTKTMLEEMELITVRGSFQRSKLNSVSWCSTFQHSELAFFVWLIVVFKNASLCLSFSTIVVFKYLLSENLFCCC